MLCEPERRGGPGGFFMSLAGGLGIKETTDSVQGKEFVQLQFYSKEDLDKFRDAVNEYAEILEQEKEVISHGT